MIATSDTHAGSTTAALRKPITMDDGPEVHPGPLNTLMASKLDEAVEWAAGLAKKYDDVPTVLLHNGDLTEGKHHHTHQVFVPEQVGYQIEVARDLLSVYTSALNPMALLFTRGTEAHVGKGGELEEATAKAMKADGHNVMQAPDTGHYAPQYWDFECGGHRIWAAHHGKVGRLPHTKGSQAALFAAHTFLQEALDNFAREQDGEDPQAIPRLIIGSHHHQKADSGTQFPTRSLQLPCWTFRNSFAHKVAAFSREDIGLAAIYCDPDEKDPIVSWWTWQPRRTTTCRI